MWGVSAAISCLECRKCLRWLSTNSAIAVHDHVVKKVLAGEDVTVAVVEMRPPRRFLTAPRGRPAFLFGNCLPKSVAMLLQPAAASRASFESFFSGCFARPLTSFRGMAYVSVQSVGASKDDQRAGENQVPVRGDSDNLNAQNAG